MELVSTMEISGEEREIADAYVRWQIDGINSNLDNLQYSDVAGGKNLFDGEFTNKVIEIGGNYTQRNLKEEFESINNLNGIMYTTFGGYFKKGTYTFSYTNDAWFSLNRIAIAGTNCYASSEQVRKYHTWTQNVDGFTYFGIESDKSETETEDTPFSITPDIMIEKGSTATTPYEPYIPSVKMLAEEVSAQNESLSVIGKCKNLLNPTLQSTTVSGVTCTANGDGTYTLNGTATANADFTLMILDNLEVGKKYKLVGCPSGGSASSYKMFLQKTSTWDNGVEDTGNGGIFSALYNKTFECWIRIYKDAIVSNLTFKPMFTENLNATYDDFVPYTGDGEALTHDVAEIKNDLAKQCKKDDITTNETLIGTFNGKNYYRKLFTGISGSGGSVTVNVGEKIEIYNYYGRAYVYGQSGSSNAKYPIPNMNYYIESQNSGETSFQLTIPTSSDTRKVDLVIEYTKVDE